MVLIFFAADGHVATILLEHQRTVTAQWYTTVALSQVFQKLREKQPRAGLRGFLLHHDNASAQTTHLRIDFLRGTPVQLLIHPPYSPDLAPCDFFLFPTVKARLRGKRFSSLEDAGAAYQGELCALDNSDWRRT